MSGLEIGLWSFPLLMALIFLRLPIGVAMALVGIGGSWLVTGSPNMILAKLKTETISTFSNYSLTIIPLFLLMGHFATLGGMSQALFKSAESWLGHRKGGVAMAAIGACAGFGAICGSSIATAATMTQVALPELRRHGYGDAISAGTLAAGGTLGILIPPSVVLVIYAMLAEQNIAKLFVAAIVPGLLAAVGYMIAIAIHVRVYPDAATRREKATMGERMLALVSVWPVLLVFAAVVGGIYGGIFTPTEAGAVGAAGTGLIALANRGLTWRTLRSAILSTAGSTAMIFVIVFGASIYNGFLALSQVPQAGAAWVAMQGFNPWLVLVIILIMYVIFGCFMDSLSMILLTIPIFFPIVSSMDFGLGHDEFAIWFGILVLVVVEVGMITPPVGMNLFIIKSMAGDISAGAIYRGVLPFLLSDFTRTVLLVLFPAITLGLMRLVY